MTNPSPNPSANPNTNPRPNPNPNPDPDPGRVDVLLDTGGVREGVPASDVAATISGEDCVAEQDLMWVSFCDSEVRLAAMRALGFARTQELGRP